MFLDHQIRVISEGSCDTDDWSNDLITGINYSLQYIHGKLSLQIVIFLLLFWSNNCLGQQKQLLLKTLKHIFVNAVQWCRQRLSLINPQEDKSHKENVFQHVYHRRDSIDRGLKCTSKWGWLMTHTWTMTSHQQRCKLVRVWH